VRDNAGMHKITPAGVVFAIVCTMLLFVSFALSLRFAELADLEPDGSVARSPQARVDESSSSSFE
jgi:hypothetical protein